MGDGRKREVLTYNDEFPGPLIVVCEGDTVNVALNNQIEDGPITNADGSPTETVLHFHGIRHVSRRSSATPPFGFGPWADGVPFVTQCPVEFKNSFTYTFLAGRNGRDMNAPPGTYWYHSHLGAQRTNGLTGGLVIKDKEPKYQNVVDNPRKQTILLQEWYESPVCQIPVSILVNGKGRVGRDTNGQGCKSYGCGDGSDENEINKFLKGKGGKFPNHKKDCPKDRGYTVFTAKPNTEYRYRIVGMIGQKGDPKVHFINAELIFAYFHCRWPPMISIEAKNDP